MSRNSMIAKIHIAKKDLGMDDETYRAVLEKSTGKTSCSKMTDRQLERVIAYFKEQGFKTKAARPLDPEPQHRKIHALWTLLAKAGAVRAGDAETRHKAIDAYVKRITGVDKMEWLDGHQINKVIETLKNWATRLKLNIDGY